MKRKVVCCLKPTTLDYYLTVPPEVPHMLARYDFDFIYCENTGDFLKYLPEAEIAIAVDFKADWVGLAPKLKWVTTNTAGKERIAEDELLKRGIKVSFARFHGQIMAETVIGMMLFTSRGLGKSYRLQKEIKWCDRLLQEELFTLRGKSCMILGYGHIGRHVARLTKSFGMYNIGVKRAVTAHPERPECLDELVPFSSFSKHLPGADHLVIILPKTSETTDIIGADELSLLKPSACIYNVGRGNCIDESALFLALKRQRIKWACLDVFKEEPLPMDSPLRTLDNILILPHSSAFAPEYYPLFFEEFLKDFERYIEN